MSSRWDKDKKLRLVKESDQPKVLRSLIPKINILISLISFEKGKLINFPCYLAACNDHDLRTTGHLFLAQSTNSHRRPTLLMRTLHYQTCAVIDLSNQFEGKSNLQSG